jgi:hypothetical protein
VGNFTHTSIAVDFSEHIKTVSERVGHNDIDSEGINYCLDERIPGERTSADRFALDATSTRNRLPTAPLQRESAPTTATSVKLSIRDSETGP